MKKNHYKLNGDKELHYIPTQSQKGVLLLRMSREVYDESQTASLVVENLVRPQGKSLDKLAVQFYNQKRKMRTW